jgi:uncharacterized protein YuzE
MKADYDSEADAISIDLCPSKRFDEQQQVDDDYYCVVSFEKGRLVNVELLSPAEHIELLEVAAERYDLDGTAIVATTHAALAAPDRIVELNLGAAQADSRGVFRHPAG